MTFTEGVSSVRGISQRESCYFMFRFQTKESLQGRGLCAFGFSVT